MVEGAGEARTAHVQDQDLYAFRPTWPGLLERPAVPLDAGPFAVVDRDRRSRCRLQLGDFVVFEFDVAFSLVHPGFGNYRFAHRVRHDLGER